MAAKRKYDWEGWFGQPTTVLVRGVDYHCSQAIMWQQVRNNARTRRVQVSITDNNDSITIDVQDGMDLTYLVGDATNQ